MRQGDGGFNEGALATTIEFCGEVRSIAVRRSLKESYYYAIRTLCCVVVGFGCDQFWRLLPSASEGGS